MITRSKLTCSSMLTHSQWTSSKCLRGNKETFAGTLTIYTTIAAATLWATTQPSTYPVSEPLQPLLPLWYTVLTGHTEAPPCVHPNTTQGPKHALRQPPPPTTTSARFQGHKLSSHMHRLHQVSCALTSLLGRNSYSNLNTGAHYKPLPTANPSPTPRHSFCYLWLD